MFLFDRFSFAAGACVFSVALSRALFIQPTMLLLDEPTNHLDLEACVWLEEYLSTYSKILVVVSHSQVGGFCTELGGVLDDATKASEARDP